MTEKGFKEQVQPLYHLLVTNGFDAVFWDERTLIVSFPLGVKIQINRLMELDREPVFILCVNIKFRNIFSVLRLNKHNRNLFNNPVLTTHRWVWGGYTPEQSLVVFERVRTHLNIIKHHIDSSVIAFSHCLRAHGVCRDMRAVIVRLAYRAVKEAELEEH